MADELDLSVLVRNEDHGYALVRVAEGGRDQMAVAEQRGVEPLQSHDSRRILFVVEFDVLQLLSVRILQVKLSVLLAGCEE